ADGRVEQPGEQRVVGAGRDRGGKCATDLAKYFRFAQHHRVDARSDRVEMADGVFVVFCLEVLVGEAAVRSRGICEKVDDGFAAVRTGEVNLNAVAGVY